MATKKDAKRLSGARGAAGLCSWCRWGKKENSHIKNRGSYRRMSSKWLRTQYKRELVEILKEAKNEEE